MGWEGWFLDLISRLRLKCSAGMEMWGEGGGCESAVEFWLTIFE